MTVVEIVEVAPRDGLQNEAAILPTGVKLELIERLGAAAVRRIEAVSFVNPKRVPQMADADAVCAGLPRRDSVAYSGLVLNERGLDRALAAALPEINVVVVCSDTFSQRNQGTTSAEGVALWGRLAGRARASGVRTTVTLAAAFGCPFEGEVAEARVRDIYAACLDAGPDEIAFADTIGVGVPTQVEALAGIADELAPTLPRRWHFHNTRNTGYANAWAAVQNRGSAQVVLDASAGGIGGCPFAPNATGNIATEDLLNLLHRAGIRTGVEVSALLPLGEWLGERLGHQVPGQLARAGVFPAG